MRSKFAIWSWILSIIGVVLYRLFHFISQAMRETAGRGSPITSPERTIGLFFSLMFLLVVVTGLVFAILGLKKIKKNPKLSGGIHSIVGIILNSLLTLFGLLRLGSVLLGG